jgi:hypothetical protein
MVKHVNPPVTGDRLLRIGRLSQWNKMETSDVQIQVEITPIS